MAESEMGTQLSDDIKDGTANLNAVDAIADAILKAVDVKQTRKTKDTSNMRKNIIDALGYKPANSSDIYSKPNGTYALPSFITGGFITGRNSFRFWLPVPCKGKSISLTATGNVSIRTPSGKAVVTTENNPNSSITAAEFNACTFTVNTTTQFGVSVYVTVPDGYFYYYGTATQTDNNIPATLYGSFTVTIS